jgi:hypothetical protein
LKRKKRKRKNTSEETRKSLRSQPRNTRSLRERSMLKLRKT